MKRAGGTKALEIIEGLRHALSNTTDFPGRNVGVNLKREIHACLQLIGEKYCLFRRPASRILSVGLVNVNLQRHR